MRGNNPNLKASKNLLYTRTAITKTFDSSELSAFKGSLQEKNYSKKRIEKAMKNLSEHILLNKDNSYIDKAIEHVLQEFGFRKELDNFLIPYKWENKKVLIENIKNNFHELDTEDLENYNPQSSIYYLMALSIKESPHRKSIKYKKEVLLSRRGYIENNLKDILIAEKDKEFIALFKEHILKRHRGSSLPSRGDKNLNAASLYENFLFKHNQISTNEYIHQVSVLPSFEAKLHIIDKNNQLLCGTNYSKFDIKKTPQGAWQNKDNETCEKCESIAKRNTPEMWAEVSATSDPLKEYKEDIEKIVDKRLAKLDDKKKMESIDQKCWNDIKSFLMEKGQEVLKDPSLIWPDDDMYQLDYQERKKLVSLYLNPFQDNTFNKKNSRIKEYLKSLKERKKIELAQKEQTEDYQTASLF